MSLISYFCISVLLFLGCIQCSPKLKHKVGFRFPTLKKLDPQKRYKKAIAKGRVTLIQLPKHGEADYMKTHVVTDDTRVVVFIVIGATPVMFMQHITSWSMSKDLYAYLLSAIMLLALSIMVYFHTKAKIRQLKHQLMTGYEDFFVFLYPDVVIRRRIIPWYVIIKLT